VNAVSISLETVETGLVTAMGFASVLTNKDVTLSVRDIVGSGAGVNCWWPEKVWIFCNQSIIAA
jgi:hypothetical protein